MRTLFFTLIILTSACTRPPADSITAPGEDRADFIIADNIRNSINRQLADKGFYLLGTGGSYYPTIRKICCDYGTMDYCHTSLDDARGHLCKIMQMYLHAFNQEPRIRPFLFNFPFNSKNIELVITFYDNTQTPLPAPNVQSVFCIDGTVTYYSSDKALLKESYETAFTKYKESHAHK